MSEGVAVPFRASILTSTTLLACALLAGCTMRSAEAPAPTALAALPVEVPDTPLPPGSGCGPSIARQQAIVDSDIATENIGASVGQRFSADLHQAAKACGAGRDGEAMRLLASAKARYGYR